MGGAVLVGLAAFTPFVLLRLLPILEVAVAAQGISRSPARAAQAGMQGTYYLQGIERMAGAHRGPAGRGPAGAPGPGAGPTGPAGPAGAPGPAVSPAGAAAAAGAPAVGPAAAGAGPPAAVSVPVGAAAAATSAARTSADNAATPVGRGSGS